MLNYDDVLERLWDSGRIHPVSKFNKGITVSRHSLEFDIRLKYGLAFVNPTAFPDKVYTYPLVDHVSPQLNADLIIENLNPYAFSLPRSMYVIQNLEGSTGVENVKLASRDKHESLINLEVKYNGETYHVSMVHGIAAVYYPDSPNGAKTCPTNMREGKLAYKIMMLIRKLESEGKPETAVKKLDHAMFIEVWLEDGGCALFSFLVDCPDDEELAHRAALIAASMVANLATHGPIKEIRVEEIEPTAVKIQLDEGIYSY